MAVITAKQEQDKKARVAKGVDAMKKPDKPEGKLLGISITPATNGYSISVDREPPETKKDKKDGDGCCSWTPPPTTVFNKKDELLAYLDQHLD